MCVNVAHRLVCKKCDKKDDNKKSLLHMYIDFCFLYVDE